MCSSQHYVLMFICNSCTRGIAPHELNPYMNSPGHVQLLYNVHRLYSCMCVNVAVERQSNEAEQIHCFEEVAIIAYAWRYL